jgi:F-type H+-transporting ATPase subunit c
MDAEAAKYIGKGLAAMGIPLAGIGQGYLIGKALEAIGRNPDVEGSLFSKMIIGAALVESLGILGFVAYYLIK